MAKDDLSEKNLLKGVDEIYSYNGSRFDLPFIGAKLGINLKDCFNHTDLMYDCWRRNLYGGLKVVEEAKNADEPESRLPAYPLSKNSFLLVKNEGASVLFLAKSPRK